MKTKRKGTDFERLIAELLNEMIKNSTWKRVPLSGSMGTILGEPTLAGDVSGTVESIPKSFKLEAKVGYGGSTQMTVKKEWFDKIKEEADRSYSIPIVAGKFSGARTGTKIFIMMDVDVFATLLNMITELKEEQYDLED